MPLDVDALASVVLDGTRALIAKATAPLAEANEELLQIAADLSAQNKALADRLAAIEEREPIHGRDGKDADPAELQEIRIRLTAAEQALAEEPLDMSGFATVEEVRAIAETVKAIPEPVDYSGEIRAVRADVAEVAKSIPDPIPGKPGVGISEVKQNADGELIVKMDNGETINAGKVRGDDGLGFDDMAFDYDGERTIALTFTRGERVERQEIVVPIVLDRGTWKERTYMAGDGVTLGGSFWIAQCETDSKPGVSKDWRLSIKRGQDGKDGVYKMTPDGPVKRK